MQTERPFGKGSFHPIVALRLGERLTGAGAERGLFMQVELAPMSRRTCLQHCFTFRGFGPIRLSS